MAEGSSSTQPSIIGPETPHDYYKKQLDGLIARINKAREANEELEKAILEQQDASREDALEARLQNNQDAIDLAEIFLGEAVKLFHMKSRGWGGRCERADRVGRARVGQ